MDITQKAQMNRGKAPQATIHRSIAGPFHQVNAENHGKNI